MPDRTYSETDFVGPTGVCDIIMKGGITSGAVYPLAIVELAKRYRFANIGGTSAGAIAAAAAAAAEYGRNVSGGGFMRLTGLPQETGAILFSLFQPTRSVAPLFDIVVAALNAKTTPGRVIRIGWAAAWGFCWLALLGAVAGAVLAFLAWRYAGIGGGAFGVLLAVIGLLIGIGFGLVRALTKNLPANNFGICSGIRQPGFEGPGFTDWLADLIDKTAGRDATREPPLTFGDLASPSGGRPPIVLRMMTTNLMLRRPYTLPLASNIYKTYKFKREDFAKLFPQRIMDHLLTHCEPVKPEAGEEGEYYRFPAAEVLPVVVAARMSLSFPGLISAVPLYSRDHTLKGDEGRKLRLCLFSDGGLSSNFPIHFFDRMLPNSPTFGISLDAYDPRRDRGGATPARMNTSGNPAGPSSPDRQKENRVWLPETAGAGELIAIQPFDGLFGFLGRLVDAAKDWQDNLQSTLAGYRDRIVHVYLKPDEGGLNIVMPPELVKALGDYGAEAGVELRDKFDLDEHRWRRFLVAMDRLDQTLDDLKEAYQGSPTTPESFETFLSRYPEQAHSYKQTQQDLALLRARAAELVALAEAWGKQPDIPERKLPRPETNLRITPKP
ncbi:MAG: hypothetical protein ACLPKB_25695 [Xanthobacteraceae bacterium]